MLSILLLMICYSCEKFDSKLTIVNNTNFVVSFDQHFYKNDTFFENFEVYLFEKINPKDTRRITILGENSWVNKLRNSPEKTIYFNFYSTDSIIKNKIKYKNMYLYYLDKKYFKQIRLNEKQLDSCNWIVTINN